MPAVTLDRNHIDAVIFDMDGVLTDTAGVHEKAWAQTFEAFLAARGEPARPFSHHDYLEHVDGKPRLDGVRDFLASRGIELPEGSPDDTAEAATVNGIGTRKNAAFRAVLEADGTDAFVDAIQFLDRLAAAGIKVAAISSSRNAEDVLTAAGIRDRFAVLVDGVASRERGLEGKPAPDIFLAAASDLGVEPARAAIVEDAAVGVTAGRRGGFALVLGLARSGDTDALRESGADAVVASLTPVSILGEARMRNRYDLPDAFGVIQELQDEAALGGREVCIFLDYDGTLTPIVERPEDAVLDPAMRRRLQAVATRFRTAVISGRGLDDLVDRVGVDDIFYAASHGFELRHPSGEVQANDAAEQAASRLGELADTLEDRLGSILGTQLERKRFGLAVHYRRARPEAAQEVEQVVQETAAAFPELTVKSGKKVFEFVPALDWHKGKALEYILETSDLGRGKSYPVFLGDDVTDEDGFRTIENWGCGIAVGLDGPPNTYATFILNDVQAVGRFLDALGGTS